MLRRSVNDAHEERPGVRNPRDARFALVPCGHQRFCESCANAVHDQSRGCSLCRTPITLVLRLY